MKVCAIADQHGLLPDIPECELLVIAGDICPIFNHELDFQFLWLNDNFRQWLECVPARRIVGIAGNHDFVFEADQHPKDLPWSYLCDSGVEVNDLFLWGTPWTPNLPSWAFQKNPPLADTHFEETVPRHTDILLTHGPPYGRGDWVPPGRFSVEGEHVGYKGLLPIISRIGGPMEVITGHIHEARGTWKYSGTTIRNVALVDDNYERGDRDPVVFDA